MMSDAQEIGRELLRVSRRTLQTNLSKIEQAVARLTDEQVWAREHDAENAVGNLLLHLAGNVRQWIIVGVGGGDDRRDRDAELAQRDLVPAPYLLARLHATIEEADRVLDAVEPETLLAKRSIQVYEVTVLHAIHHCVEHFSGHTGQILWAVKRMTGKDLGFYGYLRAGGSPPPERREP